MANMDVVNRCIRICNDASLIASTHRLHGQIQEFGGLWVAPGGSRAGLGSITKFDYDFDYMSQKTLDYNFDYNNFSDYD